MFTQETVHRLLSKMSSVTTHLRAPTFLAKILELVSSNSDANLYTVTDLQSSASIFIMYTQRYSRGSVLPLIHKFAGSNPTEAVVFFRAKKFFSTPSFRRGSKAVCPMSYIYGM